ncbi:MAG: SPOR domain-containing protein [Pseudomonadota bacterium]
MSIRTRTVAWVPTLSTLLIALSCHADFESASSAYQRQEFDAAFQEFLVLANRGDARSQTVIAMMYKYGESVPKDPLMAANWYEKAAKQGYSPAQYHLGTLYSEGRGVAQDRDEAIRWLTLASEAGFERANDALFALNVTVDTPSAVTDPTIPWSQKWDLSLPSEVSNIAAPAPQQTTPAKPIERSPALQSTSSDGDQNGFRVQLGAFSRLRTAEQLLADFQYAEPDLFDRPVMIVPPAPGGRQIYRLQAAGMDSRNDADSFCATLKARHPRAACIVVPPR